DPERDAAAICCIAKRVKPLFTAPLLAALVTLAACSASPGTPALPSRASSGLLQSLQTQSAGKIRHIVWIVQENRSFDDVFRAYPGADTVSSGEDSHGNTIALQPI